MSSSADAQEAAKKAKEERSKTIVQRREARKKLRAIDSSISSKAREFQDPRNSLLADTVRKAGAVYDDHADYMEGREVAMDTSNMAKLGTFASKQASTLNTFVDKARVRENLQEFYGPQRPGRDAEPPALAEASFAWGLLGQHMSALWRAPPSWEVMRGTFDAVLGHDAATAAARAQAAAKRALKPTKGRLLDDGRAAATADTVSSTMTSRQAALNAQRQGDLLAELKALMERAPVVALASGPPRPALPMLHTLLDPWSFTQSVENVFFFSSLVKGRNAGVDMDSAGNPVIVLGAEALQGAAGAEGGKGAPSQLGKGPVSSTYQFVWNLDRPLWRAALEVFGIAQPLLTHRDSSDSSAPPGADVKRFYGAMAHRGGGVGGGDDEGSDVGDNEMLLPVATGSQQRPALVFDTDSEDGGRSDSGDGGFVSAASSEGTPPPRRGTKRGRAQSPHSSGRVQSAARGRGRRAGSSRARRLSGE